MTGCVGLLRVCARAHAHPRACACGETPVMHFLSVCLTAGGDVCAAAHQDGWVARMKVSIGHNLSQGGSKMLTGVDCKLCRAFLFTVSCLFPPRT